MQPLIIDYLTQLHDQLGDLIAEIRSNTGEDAKPLGPSAVAGIMAQIAAAHVGIAGAAHRYIAATNPDEGNCNHG